jgi:hypothetical protein
MRMIGISTDAINVGDDANPNAMRFRIGSGTYTFLVGGTTQASFNTTGLELPIGGATVAGAGTIRLPNVASLQFKKTTSGSVSGIACDGANLLTIGHANASGVLINATGNTTINNAGTTQFAVTTAGITLTPGGASAAGSGTIRLPAGGSIVGLGSPSGDLNMISISLKDVQIGDTSQVLGIDLFSIGQQKIKVGSDVRARFGTTGIAFFGASEVAQQTASVVLTKPSGSVDTGTTLTVASYGGMSVKGNTTATTLSVTSTWYQFTLFDTDDVASGIVPDSTTDSDLTIDTAGNYFVSVDISFESSAVGDFEWQVQKNETDDSLSNLQTKRDIGNANQVGSAGMSGGVALAASDRLTLWVRRVSGSGNVTGLNVTMSAQRMGTQDNNAAALVKQGNANRLALVNLGLAA